MNLRKLLKSKKGSTLVWALVVTVVLSLILTTILSITLFDFHRTKQSQVNTQAYYTAQSINSRIAEWLTNTPAFEDKEPVPKDSLSTDYSSPWNFLEDLKSGPITSHYREVDLGPGMGEATTTVEYTSDSFDEFTITTTANCMDQTDTLVTYMNAQRQSIFTNVNTDFDYGDPKISDVLDDVMQIPTWAALSMSAGEGDGNTWWSYFCVEAGKMGEVPNSNPKAYLATNNTLFVYPNDYDQVADNTNHDYSYRYLKNVNTNAVFDDLKIYFDTSLGPFLGPGLGEGTIVPTLGPPANITPLDKFPYNNTGKKGVLVMVSNASANGNVAHKKMTYYTTPEPDQHSNNPVMEKNTDITFSCYLGYAITPSVLNYQNMHLYLTDNSNKTLYMTGGTSMNNGAVYTKRNAVFGSYLDDSGNISRAAIADFTKTQNLTFGTCSFVFADPGKDNAGNPLPQRHSVMQGCGGTGKTIMSNGSILVQNNHELAIKSGAEINATDNKGIVVEPGGSLIIDSGAVVTANIYVNSGADLTINGGATITGNIYCSGLLKVNGSFTNNQLNNMDNNSLGYVASKSGIFIFNDAKIGVGELVINGNHTVSGNSGKIHCFKPLEGISLQIAGNMFCNDHDKNNTQCLHWSLQSWTWQPDSARDTIRVP